jgi:hypothetical protein
MIQPIYRGIKWFIRDYVLSGVEPALFESRLA